MTKLLTIDDFRCGQVVRLRNSGCLMTVEGVSAPAAAAPLVACVWFDAGDNLNRSLFTPATLVIEYRTPPATPLDNPATHAED